MFRNWTRALGFLCAAWLSLILLGTLVWVAYKAMEWVWSR
jgi:hypothetical protein